QDPAAPTGGNLIVWPKRYRYFPRGHRVGDAGADARVANHGNKVPPANVQHAQRPRAAKLSDRHLQPLRLQPQSTRPALQLRQARNGAVTSGNTANVVHGGTDTALPADRLQARRAAATL